MNISRLENIGEGEDYKLALPLRNVYKGYHQEETYQDLTQKLGRPVPFYFLVCGERDFKTMIMKIWG